MNPCIIMANNIKTEISEAVWGKVNCHYDMMKDTIYVSIQNRALNCEPFRMTLYDVSKDVHSGTSSYVIAHTLLDDYRRYIHRYIWR